MVSKHREKTTVVFGALVGFDYHISPPRNTGVYYHGGYIVTQGDT